MYGQLEIRIETPEDIATIHAVNTAAFARETEADLVDALRAAGALSISLVATLHQEIIGHIAFSPVTIGTAMGPIPPLALAPMAVDPRFQNQGVGSRLVNAGLREAASLGAPLVIVLGHPEFYPRFGFIPAGAQGIRCPYEAPPEAFLVRELTPGATTLHQGIVRYHPAFDRIT